MVLWDILQSLGESADDHRRAVVNGGRRTIRKMHLQFEQAAFPDGLLATRDGAVPAFQIERALWGFHRSRDEAKWVILAPRLTGKVSAKVKQFETDV